MKVLTVEKGWLLAIFAGAALLAVVAWAALAGGPAEPVASDRVGIEVISPQGIATLEGELRRP